jgi:hypothetical protein
MIVLCVLCVLRGLCLTLQYASTWVPLSIEYLYSMIETRDMLALYNSSLHPANTQPIPYSTPDRP